MDSASQAPTNTDQSRSSAVLVVLIVGTVLSTLAVLVRVYSRHILLHSFGKDDTVMVMGQFFLLTTAVAMGIEYHFGMGKHLSEVPDEDYVPYMKAFFASTILYSFAIYLVKISIMLQYCRIFQDTRFYRFYFYITIGLSCWTVLMCLLLPFICVPIQRFWNHDTPGTCLNILALWMAVSVINMVTDITCFIIPIPPLLTLRMPTRTKILLAFIFGLALCPCIISAYRITTLTATAHSTDSTWDNANTAMWSFLELSIGAIAACLPTYRPVLSTLMPRVFTPSSHSGNMRTDPPTHQQGFSLQTSHSNVRKSRYDTESTRGLGLVDANDHGYSTLEEEEAVSTRSVS